MPPQKPKKPKKPQFALQASWNTADWPRQVYPNDPERARYIVRANKDSLIAAGAIARVGRELIILGDRYQRWLELHTANVSDFIIAPNRARREAAVAEL
jgi:hypothetical protein